MPDHPARLAPHGLVLAIALMLAVPSNAWSDNHEVGETAAYTITPDHARPGARLWVQGQCDARRETASIGVARSEDDPNYNWQTDPDFYWRVNYTTSIVDGTFEGPMEVPADAPPGLYRSSLQCATDDAVGGSNGPNPFVVDGQAGTPTSSTVPGPTTSTAPPVTTRPRPPSTGGSTPSGPAGESEPSAVTVTTPPTTSPSDDAVPDDELASSRTPQPRSTEPGPAPWIGLLAAVAVIATALGAHRAWRHRSP